MNSSKAFRLRIFLFRYYSSGIETINTSIHVRSRSYLENHIRSQTKMGKFETKKAPKSYPLGRRIPIWHIYKGAPPGPD